MQLRAEQLEGHLAKSLAGVYAIHGDEPLLALEAADAVRAAARKRGFAERVVLDPGRGFDWSEFTHAAQSLSLFAEKKIVELRLASGKPGTQGGEAIAGYCAQPAADLLLLVSLPRVDRTTQSSAWFSALGRAGVMVDVWPVERARLPAWIAERLARQRQSAPREVLEFLAERVEGNLLAAHQEVRKLALAAPEGELTLETVQDAVSNVARYDPYVAAALLCLGHVGLVGFEDFLPVGTDRRRGGAQRLVLRGSLGARQQARRGAGSYAQVADRLLDVKLLIHGPILAQA